METLTTETTDSSLVQVRAARKVSAQAGGECIARAFDAVSGIRQLEIDSINALREAGIHFNVASGRNQLTFTGSGFDFVRAEILPHLPATANMNHVRLAVHLAGVLPEPISTQDELRAVKSEVQQMLVLFNLCEAPRRKELQNAHARNYFADFTNTIGTMRMILEKIEDVEPMTEWPREKLEEFREDAIVARNIVNERIERAERLIEGGGR